MLALFEYCLEKEDIQIIVKYWIRILNIKLGWIHEFDKLVVNYVMCFVNLFFIQITINIIDYSTFDCGQLICSGSNDNTVRVWNIEDNKQIRLFNGHSKNTFCVKFSLYYYRNYRCNVICSSSADKTIRFWDFKHNRQLQLFNGHTGSIYDIKFSPFNSGRYLCSGSLDKTIRLWDIETFKSLHIFNGHEDGVCCVDISLLQSSNNNKNDNSIGVIGGNGYTICSGSYDKTIRIWDVETTRQLIAFKGHKNT
ncbi:WD-40 repeat protein, partial [Reticulomyxa filosa]